MANNDRLKQIISNLQILSNLSSSMVDSEIYPVSFFSQAFDLIQKIQSDIQTLEADQVELFATQMKKHQALIMSIHQQMRNISSDFQEQKPTPETSTKKPISTNEAQKPAIKKGINKPETNVPKQIENKPKKVSFFSRLGRKPSEPTEKPSKKENEAVNTPKKTDPVIIENPISAPAKSITLNRPEIKPTDEKTSIKTENPGSSTIKTQTDPTAKSVIPPKPATSPVLKETSAKTTTHATPTHKTKATPYAAPTTAVSGDASIKTANDHFTAKETNGSQSLNDAIEKQNLSDLRKAFSLNDRFRYRKELFGGNEEIMNKAITILNNKASFKDSVIFLEEKLHWDFSNPTVKDFIKVLELRFL